MENQDREKEERDIATDAAKLNDLDAVCKHYLWARENNGGLPIDEMIRILSQFEA